MRLRPGDAEAHNLLGGALDRIEEGRAAEAEFEEALKLEPDYENARLNLARVEAREGRFDAALGDYRKILKADPGDEAATAGLARALEVRGGQLEALGETVEAEGLYKEWVEVAPKSAAAHDALGRTLEAMGEYGRAASEFEAAVRLEPGNADYARHRAEAGKGR